MNPGESNRDLQAARGAASADVARPSISVVIPVHDEESTLRELHDRLRRCLPADAEIIFVDDGSRDHSARVIAEILRRDARAVGLRLRRAFGKSAALARGFERARGERIATIDADLQEDPEQLVVLSRRLSEPGDAGAWSDAESECFDLVTGWRRRRRDPPLKVLGSRVFNLVVSRLSGCRQRDMNCGLKIMRRDVVESLRLEGGFHRFIPLLAHWKGFRVGEVEIPHHPRAHGRSRYGGERIVHGLIDLLVLLFLERFERRPSRFFLGLGGLLFASGFGIGAYITGLKIATGTIQSRYPLLMLGMLLLVIGTQLLSMGFLAELVARRRAEPGVPMRRDAAPVAEELRPAPPREESPAPVEARRDAPT